MPLLVNFWMRSLFASGTKTLPLASTASSKGSLNCPSPLPRLPHLVMNVPHATVAMVVVVVGLVTVVVLLLDVVLVEVVVEIDGSAFVALATNAFTSDATAAPSPVV